jgi:hypothetical protein
MVVGFATSCMNRRWQLEYTLPQNLEVLRGTGHFLAVVDYGSRDDLGLFLRQFEPDIAAGTLVCFRTETPRKFHMSMAKNTAHRLALRRRPSVLFNLDADNFVTEGTLLLLEQTFVQGPEPVLHNLCPTLDDGSFGRVALRSETWQRLGGYDETILAASWGDIDLLYRCRSQGLTYVQSERGLRAPVSNSADQKVVDLDLPPSLKGKTSMDVYIKARRQNLLTCLGRRPMCLALEEQRHYDGLINFTDAAVV